MDATAPTTVPPRKAPLRTGSLLVIAFVLVFVAGWFVYRPFIPPVWLHDLAADIALRAAADPNARLPEDSRQASPRGLADSPYICAAKVIHEPWDRLIIVGGNQNPRDNPLLADARWPKNNFADLSAEMARDARYQLVVLLKDNTVDDAQFFFTFWGDLKALARPEGFTPAEAIFTAESKDGVYVVQQPADIPADACK